MTTLYCTRNWQTNLYYVSTVKACQLEHDIMTIIDPLTMQIIQRSDQLK